MAIFVRRFAPFIAASSVVCASKLHKKEVAEGVMVVPKSADGRNYYFKEGTRSVSFPSTLKGASETHEAAALRVLQKEGVCVDSLKPLGNVQRQIGTLTIYRATIKGTEGSLKRMLDDDVESAVQEELCFGSIPMERLKFNDESTLAALMKDISN